MVVFISVQSVCNTNGKYVDTRKESKQTQVALTRYNFFFLVVQLISIQRIRPNLEEFVWITIVLDARGWFN